MRVVIVAESFLPRINGVTNSVLRSTQHLLAGGHHVEIIAPEPAPTHVIDGARVHGIRSWTIPGMGVDVAYATAGRLTTLMRSINPDVVHLASPLILGLQALRASRELGIPTVAVFQTDITGFARHYGLMPLASLSDAVVRKVHTEADLTLAPSRSSLDYLSSLGVTRARLWGRGVDTEQFHPGRRDEELRHSWGVDGTRRLAVGYVGRLAPEKRVDSLAALASDPRIQLVIVGDGPQRAELEATLPSAHFTGLLTGEHLGTAMASLDVAVAPGERETFCQVVQEAMAAGVPIVAPACGGPLDLIDHGRTGLLYAPGDSHAMAMCVRGLVADSAQRSAIGASGRSEVSGRTWQGIGDQLIGHYRSVLAPVSSPGIEAA